MNLSALAVKRPVAVLMVVLMVLLLGIVSLSAIPIDLYPEMSLPMALIIAQYEGAGPQEVENMVTRPIEEAVSTVSDLDSISSISSAGSSAVFVMFSWGTDMDFASLEIREKIDLIKRMLPSEVENPLVFQLDPDMMPVLQLGVSGDMDQVALKDLAENVIKNRIERLNGVAVCDVGGGLTREIMVRIDPYKLAAYGISLDQIILVLRSENINFSGGDLIDGNRQYLVRTTGEFMDIQEIGSIVVGGSSTGPIHLRDLAEIDDCYKEPDMLARMNGEPTIFLAVNKQTGGNTVQVADRVQKELQKLEEELPGNIKFEVAYDQSDFIKESIGSVADMAVMGAILAIIVLYLFLGDIQSTLIIGISIPISIIATFVLMYFQGLTLNMVTMGGLALGVGMIVDNSIVILENIFRFRRQGKNSEEASLRGSQEVSSAVIASTLTTMVVFLPVVFVKGLASIIFSSMSWTVSFSLLASLIVALTIVPVLSSKILRTNNREKERENIFRRAFKKAQDYLEGLAGHYRRLLAWALNRRKLIVIICLVSLVGSFALVPLVGYEFLPSADMGEILINVRMPIGTPLEQTDEVVKRIEGYIEEYEDTETVFSIVGSGGLMSVGTNSHRASINVLLCPINERRMNTQKIAEELRHKLSRIPGSDITVVEQDIAGGLLSMESSPINLMVKGDDLEVLERITDDLAEIVNGVEGTREVTTSFTEGRPELQIKLDRERAASLGISTNQVASAIRMALEGQVATRYRVGGEEIDIRVQASESGDLNIVSLEQLTVKTSTGANIPIGEVAVISQELGPIEIQRDGQVRTASVTGSIVGRDLGRVMQDIQEEANKYSMPMGYMLEYGGEQSEMVESFRSLTIALLLAICLVYMIMAAQFESLLYPFIIMFSLPQSFIGVVLALAITGRTLNVSSFIGVIMLAGIVVNNGIILVDYINILRRDYEYDRDEAILEAGKTRLRPILMTTLTTILGMLPMAFGIGEGAEARAPMATVIIGGLTVSSIMTLVLVPVVYAIMDDTGRWISKKIKLRKAGRGMAGEG